MTPAIIPDAPHVFSTYIDLPVVYTDTTLFSFLAMSNNKDTLTQSQMLKAHDQDQFITSQIPEIRRLETMQVFEYCPMHALPPKARLLSSIWSYRRKRKPDGKLLKHKAHICVDGSQQAHGRDYWETYAPVVSWSTVCLILLLSNIMNLKSQQVDYLCNPVYMRIPQGWHISLGSTLEPHMNPKHNDSKHYIKLWKNLHGCKQAAQNWFQHLDQGLKVRGFCQSQLDPCLYLKNDCIHG